jgi:hypothetical protein
MKMKLIVSLLALCLALSVVSVQAQTDKDIAGNMEDMSAILTGKISETITCNMTGNAAMVGMNNTSGKMENMTGDMGEAQNGNMIGNMSNMTRPMTFNVDGKVVIVKDLGNMTEKALIIGEMENMPGKVVIFGEMDKMGVVERMDNISANMPAGMAEKLQNMTIVKVGTMTGTMTGNMTRNMENTSGMAENMQNTSRRMENLTVLMAGDITGTIAYDLTEKMIIIRNMGSMEEVVEKTCNMHERMNNTTMNNTTMKDMTRPMICNMTGSMIILKDMDNMVSMVEQLDNMPVMAEKMNYMSGIDPGMVILEDTDTNKVDGENTTRMPRNMETITGKMAIIRNMDDMTQITTNTIKCNITGNTTMIDMAK